MNRRSPVLLASLLLVACGDSNSGSESSSSEASTGGGSTSTATDAATDTTNAATEATAASSTDAPTSSTTDPGTDTEVGTTGEPAWCYGYEGDEGAPRLELFGHGAAKLVNGGKIALQCGGQGLFMFALYPSFGGFTPPGDQVTFDVVVDVAGHNTNPAGHFYSITDSIYYIGCDPILGGVLGVVPVIPPDNEDLLTLEGLAADFHVVLHTPQGDVVVDLQMTLSAKDDGSWGFCGQG